MRPTASTFIVLCLCLESATVSGSTSAELNALSARTVQWLPSSDPFNKAAVVPELTQFWRRPLSVPITSRVAAMGGKKSRKRKIKATEIRTSSTSHQFLVPSANPFIPEKRRMTIVGTDGSVALLPAFQTLLGHVDRPAVRKKTFAEFPIVAVLATHRATRVSYQQLVENNNPCPLCDLIRQTPERLLPIGNDFAVIPDAYPYFEQSGTIVKLDHRRPTIDSDLTRSMLQTLYELGPFGYRIGYNHMDTGEKIRHQSYAIFRERMPIEDAATTPFLDYDEMQISRIEDFPIHGFVIESIDLSRF